MLRTFESFLLFLKTLYLASWDSYSFKRTSFLFWTA